MEGKGREGKSWKGKEDSESEGEGLDWVSVVSFTIRTHWISSAIFHSFYSVLVSFVYVSGSLGLGWELGSLFDYFVFCILLFCYSVIPFLEGVGGVGMEG